MGDEKLKRDNKDRKYCTSPFEKMRIGENEIGFKKTTLEKKGGKGEKLVVI